VSDAPALDPKDPEALIVYPVGEEENIDIEPWRYPESFAWGLWCSATMIHPRVAMTAAHCVFEGLDGTNPKRPGSNNPIRVTLAHHTANGPSHTTEIVEIRKNECYQQNYENYI